MKTKVTLAAITAFAALMTSCSSYTLTNSEVYNNADLASYHTFRIVTPDEGSLPPGMEMVTYYNIAAAVREQLVERGFVEDPSSALLVNLGVTVHKEIATEPLSQVLETSAMLNGPAVPPPGPVVAPNPGPRPAPGAGPGSNPGPGAGPVPPVYNGMYPYFIYPRVNYWNSALSGASVITGMYKEGVLTMDMVNMVQKLPLYTASVATILGDGDGGFRNLSGIAEAVKVLFSKFPVPLLPQYR